MVELLGWIGLFLFAGTLFPFITRRVGLRHLGIRFYTKYHCLLALTSLAVFILHGLTALIEGQGLQWERLLHTDILTGFISLLLMLIIVILAMASVRRMPFRRTHCKLAILLVVFFFLHIL
ncbi:MAG: hypothetical protein M0T74_05165 [Desulfitobacterium hafniense]|nr:hypothetical protein [Desulfitobacterium hafniense]